MFTLISHQHLRFLAHYERDLYSPLHAISVSQILRMFAGQALLRARQDRLATPGSDISLPKQNDIQFCTWYDYLVCIPCQAV